MNKGNGNLREAIKTLPILRWSPQKKNGEIIYSISKGTASSVCLYENNRISIARTHVNKGSVFPSHVHKNIQEYILMEEGTIELFLCEIGEKTLLEKSDCFIVPCSTLHSAKVLEDSVIIAISMPPDPDFPHPDC